MKYFLSIVIILVVQLPALSEEKTTKQKIGVEIINSTIDNNDQTKIYYQLEHKIRSDTLKVELEQVFKKEEQITKVKVEYEF